MLIRTIVLSLLLLVAYSIAGQDDADYNKTAKTIKKDLVKKLRKLDFEATEYCDLMLELKVNGNTATIRRAHGSGSTSMCRESKKILRKNKKYHMDEPEKYLRIHVESKGL
ncbi:hypothetical protein KP803_17205 [Vibrio sp. ZSDE26]|uniref:Uncharacterized protein n=1 Tax=Vibrio amylolyticus TaxID=2847292 RepID=A0A9X1XLK1_9VIBR|nr:hypothetical protein [Vibrio amylolyticus]MCK6265019.1 hypothetical protein [Vibrio amylolyticus]